jgi:hypothetical protein
MDCNLLHGGANYASVCLLVAVFVYSGVGPLYFFSFFFLFKKISL